MMKLTNIAQFNNLKDYVSYKLEQFKNRDKTYEVLFEYMFSEKDNVFAELTNGYKISKITYGECKQKIQELSCVFCDTIKAEKGSKIAIAMDNSVEWIQTFWALLMAGYNPVFFNLRLPTEVLEKVIATHQIKAIVSDKNSYSVDTYFIKDLIEQKSENKNKEEWGQEVIFMSSGTTGEVKLCSYTAENFYYQICDSLTIVENCPQIGEHYNGELKNLVLLPLYHVFGFIAVYLWFTFFSRTLVFLKDLKPQTLLNTIKKHKVTHIFAVPLVWDKIYKEAIKKIKARGNKTYAKFLKGLKLANGSKLGRALTKNAFKEVRENLFGDSIKFLISGGSAISKETIEFFNGIGYHMANGYGMTEIGITSVEISNNHKVRNLCSIGHPFSQTEYSINEKGELLVRGKTRASKIITSDKTLITDFSAWFNTCDLAEQLNGGYYLKGRVDDLIVCQNGENLNPEILEQNFLIKGVNSVCMFMAKEPTLLVSIEPSFSAEKIKQIQKDILTILKDKRLADEIKKVDITCDSLTLGGDFKISRKKVAKRYIDGHFDIIDVVNAEKEVQKMLSSLQERVIKCFAEVLEKPTQEIGVNQDFFADLGGSSLDYFSLLEQIKQEFNVEISQEEKLSCVEDFCKIIKR